MLAVREGKLSPLAIKRLPPVLHKPEQTQKDYNTYEQSKVQIQQAFERTERIIGLIAETGAGKTYAAGSYVLNNEAISLNRRFLDSRRDSKAISKAQCAIGRTLAGAEIPMGSGERYAC